MKISTCLAIERTALHTQCLHLGCHRILQALGGTCTLGCLVACSRVLCDGQHGRHQLGRKRVLLTTWQSTHLWQRDCKGKDGGHKCGHIQGNAVGSMSLPLAKVITRKRYTCVGDSQVYILHVFTITHGRTIARTPAVRSWDLVTPLDFLHPTRRSVLSLLGRDPTLSFSSIGECGVGKLVSAVEAAA